LKSFYLKNPQISRFSFGMDQGSLIEIMNKFLAQNQG